MTSDDPTRKGGRVIAVDVLRGLVLLLLVPDTLGAFSFYRMAELYPDSAIWRALAAQFTHVEWTGAAVWDLVMPLFVFLVGVSMPMSYERRKSEGVSERELLGGAALRSATLIVLGLFLQMSFTSHVDELLLFAVIATGLPLATIVRRVAGGSVAPAATTLRLPAVIGTVLVLVCAVTWMAVNLRRLGNYELHQILILIGLAYLPAFFLMRYRDGVKAAAGLAIVAAYALAFALYAPQPLASQAGVASAGVAKSDAWLSGAGSHWNSGANLAAAFDQWLLNVLPRSEPYAGNAHDYHTLQFVPLIAVMLFGAIAGRRIVEDRGRVSQPWRFVIAGTAGLAASWFLAATLFPLVKSLWTPSWTIFSTSVSLILLGIALRLFGSERRARLAMPLVILGTNSILLYVLAMAERWRVVAIWQRLLPPEWLAVSWRPVLESLLVLATFWMLAAILYRLRIFVRI